MSDNIIAAYLRGRGTCTTAAVYQYDSGMILRISGIELPQALLDAEEEGGADDEA